MDKTRQVMNEVNQVMRRLEDEMRLLSNALTALLVAALALNLVVVPAHVLAQEPNPGGIIHNVPGTVGGGGYVFDDIAPSVLAGTLGPWAYSQTRYIPGAVAQN